MEALLQEIERLEKEELKSNKAASPENKVEEVQTETEEKPAEVVDEKKEEQAPEVVAVNPEEEQAKKAQEAYKERQRAKKEEAERKKAEALRAAKEEAERQELLNKYAVQEKPDDTDEIKQKLKQVDQILLEKKIDDWKNRAERELSSLESEFKVAFTDYDDVVKTALEITKDRMINSGMSDYEASEALRFEKLKIANAAAARGEDPAEAVYREAKAVQSWFETYASKLGYVKAQGKQDNKEKTLTQKAALREASKPNAISGGRNANALKLSYDEMDDVSDVTIGELMSGKI